MQLGEDELKVNRSEWDDFMERVRAIPDGVITDEHLELLRALNERDRVMLILPLLGGFLEVVPTPEMRRLVDDIYATFHGTHRSR